VSEPLRITHLLPRIGLTGPVRNLAAFAKYAARLGLDQEHRVLALESRASPLALALLRREGVTCELAPERAVVDEACAEADVVVVHWWSCPSLAAFLMKPIPPTRLALWVHVEGGAPPQVLTDGVVALADRLLLTTPGTLEAPALHSRSSTTTVEVVPAIGDMEQLENVARLPHDGVVVGYLGTVNRAKMHPRFVELCAAVTAPDARFVVVGSGGEEQALRDEAQVAGLGRRFEVRGYAPELAPALSEMDVFGYPLREGTYASSEIALQEAMWVGLPPVVFPYGGIRYLVDHERTGLVARNEEEYSHYVDRLVLDHDLRDDIGRRAQEEARRRFAPEGPCRTLDRLLRDLAADDARTRTVPNWGPAPGHWFAHSLGAAGAPFLRDLDTRGSDAAAIAAIAALSNPVARGEGGLFHWANHFPEDSALQHWASIVKSARP
jgi:glycosyltransferase involved in cell wall biosynthesis